jgi:hypothetical protein
MAGNLLFLACELDQTQLQVPPLRLLRLPEHEIGPALYATGGAGERIS